MLSLAILAKAETPEQAFTYISPVPSSELILKETTILLRTGRLFTGDDSQALTDVTLTGTLTGRHTFEVILSDDYLTAILKTGSLLRNLMRTSSRFIISWQKRYKSK